MTIAQLRKTAAPYRTRWVADAIFTLRFRLELGQEEDFPEARSVAYTEQSPRGLVIFYRPVALDLLSRAQLLGVLFHELGHVFELTYGEGVVREILAACGVRPSALEERRADQLAGAVFGHTISYDEDLVQTTARGAYAARPRGLG
jgi:hypothetical protein